MRHSPYLAALALGAGASLALAGTTGGTCASGSCAVTPEAAAWAQVATGVKGDTIAYPRSTRGAVLQRIRLSTQQPEDGGDATVCDGRQEATARYRWRGKSVTFRNVTIAGEDCTSGDPLRFRCTTRTISGLGRTRDCTSAKWRIITWGRYVPRVGGQYELSGPRAFPLIAVARSVR
jgi:hypothetical protein